MGVRVQSGWIRVDENQEFIVKMQNVLGGSLGGGGWLVAGRGFWLGQAWCGVWRI